MTKEEWLELKVGDIINVCNTPPEMTQLKKDMFLIIKENHYGEFNILKAKRHPELKDDDILLLCNFGLYRKVEPEDLEKSASRLNNILE